MKLFVISLILLLALMASCTSAPSPLGGTFIEGETGGDAETLNWILAADAASFSYVGHTLDSLATYDNNWNVVLRHLAKPVEISADGLTYTITIRDDLKWSDGEKVTAEDYCLHLKEPHVLRLAELPLQERLAGGGQWRDGLCPAQCGQ